MKKILSVLAVLFLFAACDEYYFVSGILSPGFKSATGADRALLVRNNTQENLVAFQGTADVKNLIGGIRAGETSHYFSKNKKNNPNAEIFSTSHDFPLVLMRHDDYKANLTDLSAAPVFTTIYVAYNADADPSTYAYEISGKLGGAGTLIINNNTSMSVDLRLDGINGVSLGYAPANHKNTRLNLGAGDYEIFVVFRQYSPKLKETVTYYPVDNAGDPRMAIINISDAEMVLDIEKEYLDMDQLSYDIDYAYLTVHNDFNNGIELRNGSSIVYTTNGTKIINSGDYYSFQMAMPKAGSSVVDSQTFGSLKVVSGVKSCDLPEIKMDKGYVYSIRMVNNNDKLEYVKDESTGEIILGKTKIDLGDIFSEE